MNKLSSFSKKRFYTKPLLLTFIAIMAFVFRVCEYNYKYKHQEGIGTLAARGLAAQHLVPMIAL
ncbi:MAG: hypothetical protein WDM71_08420 [Ferruginibacter sp.]